MTLREHFESVGLQKGIQEGMHRSRLETAQRMLSADIDKNLISQITTLPLHVIEELAADLMVA